MNRKIFIDCGFYAGVSRIHFKLTPEYSSDFTYYGFDPVIKIDEARKRCPDVILDNKAVWIEDGEIDFYISRRHSGKANSIYHNNRSRNECNLKVKCFNFSKWLRDNFDMQDYIVLKMDIEGSEYSVIPKMIEDSTINFIDIIYLEWHAGRYGDIKYKKAVEITKELQKIEGLTIRKSLERYLRSLNLKK